MSVPVEWNNLKFHTFQGILCSSELCKNVSLDKKMEIIDPPLVKNLLARKS